MNKIERLMQNLPEEIDAGLIVSPPNRRYFTGFPSSAGLLLVTREATYFLIDFRYIEAARAKVKGCEIQLLGDTKQDLCSLCKKHNIKRIAVENSYLNLGGYQSYRSMLEGIEVLDSDAFDKAVLAQRRKKTQEEIDLICAAQKLTDETFSYICTRIEAGRTERDIALDMEFYMRKAGAEAVSFDFIVVSGANSSLPHGVPSDKKVEKGDFLTMDFGALVDGYHSDMTRTVAVGEVSEEQRRLYETVLAAQTEAIGAIQVGKTCKEIDAVARNLIYQAGYEGCFGHGLGHAVGVEIHENPRFSALCSDVVEPGLVMTVEPGIYLPGKFGARIEDMVYITEEGIQNLTHSPKELILL